MLLPLLVSPFAADSFAVWIAFLWLAGQQTNLRQSEVGRGPTLEVSCAVLRVLSRRHRPVSRLHVSFSLLRVNLASGLGASHQTGWTGLIANCLIEIGHRREAEKATPHY